MVKNLIGPPVTGDNFYGREKELEEALILLNQGNSLLLASPRRVGKSSFSRKIIELSEKQGYSSMYVDLQGVISEQEFGERLADAFRKVKMEESKLYGVMDSVGRLFHRVKKVEVKGVGLEFREDNAKFYSEVEKLIGNLPKRRVLVVIDELAVFLQRIEEQSGIEAVEAILNWLRKMRQNNQDKLLWIFCSSVSITNYASRNNLSYTINDLTPFKLGEMSFEEASGLLHQLCIGQSKEPFNKEDTETILLKLGWKLPFFIQLFFNYYQRDVQSYMSIGMEAASDKIIDLIITEHQLSSWSERLAGYGKYEKPAQLLLNYLCLPEHKSDRKHLESIIKTACVQSEDPCLVYSEVRQMLDTDGYLMEDDKGNIIFRSPIIRQYWFNKFVK